MIRTAKAILVRILIFAPFDRYIISYLRFAFGSAETILRGYRNALLIGETGAAPETLLMAYAASGEGGDPERFFLQLAIRVAENPSCKEIDILFLANDARPLTVYSAVARLFGRRLNFRMFTDARALSDAADTAGARSLLEHLDRCERLILPIRAFGGLKPPLLFKNAAREYLKSVDAIGRFCAISLPSGVLDVATGLALAQVVQSHLDWHFILLNDAMDIDNFPQQLPTRVLVPSRTGIDFLTRLCIAAEVDAYAGSADLYGLVAHFAGTSVSLLSGAYSSSDIWAVLASVDQSTNYSSEAFFQGLASLLSKVENERE